MKRMTRWVFGGMILSAALLLTPAAKAFNPQPEPPANIFKLLDGREAIIVNKRVYLLTPAPQGSYEAANGFRFKVGAQGIIDDNKPGQKQLKQ